MRFPKHFILATITLLTATVLSACTPAPEPDEALIALYTDALHDSEALLQSAPAVAALRREHAEEINEEIRRVCGYTDEGTVPESCTFAIPDLAAAPTDKVELHIADSQARILTQLNAIPTDSIPLITEQYIEQARLGPAVGDIDVHGGLILAEEDLASAQDLLAQEYAAAWALGVALAYVAPELQNATENALDHHREYAGLLRSTIEPFAAPSPAEAGYDLGSLTTPVDPGTALVMITEIQNHAIASWHDAASQATDPHWRSLATQIAGVTAQDTVAFT